MTVAHTISMHFIDLIWIDRFLISKTALILVCHFSHQLYYLLQLTSTFLENSHVIIKHIIFVI